MIYIRISLISIFISISRSTLISARLHNYIYKVVFHFSCKTKIAFISNNMYKCLTIFMDDTLQTLVGEDN